MFHQVTCLVAFLALVLTSVAQQQQVQGEELDLMCPEPSGRPGICRFDPEVNCLDNDFCPKGQLCCKEGCGRVCKHAVPRPRDLVCPEPSGRIGNCRFDPGVNCLSDNYCPEGMMCCREGCGSICKQPVPRPRVLVCPKPSGRPGICRFDPNLNCLGNDSCPKGQLCCKEGCGRVCKRAIPVLRAEMSRCPPRIISYRSCMRALREEGRCTSNRDCPTGKLCCPNSCGRFCRDPDD